MGHIVYMKLFPDIQLYRQLLLHLLNLLLYVCIFSYKGCVMGHSKHVHVTPIYISAQMQQLRL